MEEGTTQTNKDSKDLKDIIILFSVIIIILIAASMLDLFVKMRNIASTPDGFRIVEFLFVITLFGIAYGIFVRRRAREYKNEIKTLKINLEELNDNIKRFRSTVDLSPDTITIFKNGRLMFINNAGLNLFGANNEEELIGKNIDELVHYSFKEKMTKLFNEMEIYMKKYPPLDIMVRRLDGKYLDVNAASTPVPYHAIPHVITILRDISERKKSEEIKNQLASIVMNSSDAIYTMSTDGQIQNWNPGAEKLYNISHKDAVGKNISIVVPENYRNELQNLLTRVSQGEIIQSLETKRQKKDKTIIDVSLTLSPIWDDANVVKSISAISRDITLKKQTEEALRKYSEELALSNEELYVFSYAASHDLQEPLRSVQNFIDTLKKRPKRSLGIEIQSQLNSIEDSVERMNRLVNDFLIYSRVGTERAVKEEVDCNLALKDALANLAIAIKESNAKIEHFSLPKIYCNFLQITQVFQNLISNAIKYRGEKIPNIKISAEKQDNQWLFKVADNGIGIEQWYHERIFLVFFKLHDPKIYPGSGIGLALCKRVIEKHGGKIWLESQANQGTTFYFTLPIMEHK